MSRLTDNDIKCGPFTFGRSTFRAFGITIASRDDHYVDRCHLSGYGFGWAWRIWIPEIVKPFSIRHTATSWDAATVARMGRDWYDEIFPREYGFRLSDGFLQVFLGAQTHDSSTTQNWCKLLPWKQWRTYRQGYFGLDGELLCWFYEGKRPSFELYEETRAFKESIPKRVFDFDDYDGQRIQATTFINQHEMKLGTGWFKWLSLFRRNKVRRSLDITFSAEVGPEKGSWKGGTLGHGIAMLPGELHEAAFRRYCGEHQLTFVGVASA